jgi:hypothetical protein
MKNIKKIAIFLSAAVITVGAGVIALDQMGNTNSDEKPVDTLTMEYPHYDSVDHLSETASDIVKGRIIDSRVEEIDIRINPNQSEDSSEEPLIYTVYTIKVNDVYKGINSIGDTIQIKQLGGETEERIQISEASLELGKTSDYVFFLQSYDGLPASILNQSQSTYLYNAKTRSLSDHLVSVGKDNDLSLTYENLLNISNVN